MKRIVPVLAIACVVGVVGYRVSALESEAARQVYNIDRIHQDVGLPVETISLKSQAEALRFQLSLVNGRAWVAGDIQSRLKVGMSVGTGKIVAVAKQVDFDTGLYEVLVSKNLTGEFFAEEKSVGIFIPRSALDGNSVWINDNGIAARRNVKIAAVDSSRALISGGAKDGDVLIVSSTADLVEGVKLQ